MCSWRGDTEVNTSPACRRYRRFLGTPIAVLLLVCVSQSVAARDVSMPSLKAAFLANFAKFADWPDDALPPGHVFTFCVAGDKAVATALEQSINYQPGPNALTVMIVALDGPLRSCHVLYAGGLKARQSLQVIEVVKGAPVFTVSDAEGFAEAGGVAQLIVDKGRMRFAINPAAAKRARIALSAKLLSLATLVKDAL